MPLLVDHPLAAYDHHVFLHVVNIEDALDQAIDIEWHLGDEHDIRLAIAGPEREVARMPAHDLDDGDPAMALGGGADALHAGGRHKDGRRNPRSHIVDHVIERESPP